MSKAILSLNSFARQKLLMWHAEGCIEPFNPEKIIYTLLLRMFGKLYFQTLGGGTIFTCVADKRLTNTVSHLSC